MSSTPNAPLGCLGKRPARIDPRTRRLSRLLPDLPTPPDLHDWSSAITDWGVMRNDTLGDCTIAALAHAIQGWSAALGSAFTLPDSVIVDAYSRWCGYRPDAPWTDQGGVELDVLNLWRKEPQVLSDEILVGYADPDPQDTLHVQQAVWLFGGLYIGLGLPESAQDQTVWDVATHGDTRPWSWGGHAVWVVAYDPRTLTCVTWGRLQKMTWAFWRAYCDEAHCLLSRRWLDWASKDYHFLGDLAGSLCQI